MIQLIAFERKLNEKSFIKCNKLPAIIYRINNQNKIIKLINNSIFYKYFKLNLILCIKLLNNKYITKIINISYHSFKNLLIHIEFLNLNVKI